MGSSEGITNIQTTTNIYSRIYKCMFRRTEKQMIDIVSLEFYIRSTKVAQSCFRHIYLLG